MILLALNTEGILQHITDTNTNPTYSIEPEDFEITAQDFEKFSKLEDPRKWDSMTFSSTEGWVTRGGFDPRYYYAEDRKSSYPPIEDQLDQIFHEGVNVWKASIQLIKDEYPKPPPLEPSYLP
jgi:hypothetical protein